MINKLLTVWFKAINLLHVLIRLFVVDTIHSKYVLVTVNLRLNTSPGDIISQNSEIVKIHWEIP